jgi:hypothetical protein
VVRDTHARLRLQASSYRHTAVRFNLQIPQPIKPVGLHTLADSARWLHTVSDSARFGHAVSDAQGVI